jgi:hypothetical protein
VSARENFTPKTVSDIARAAMYVCSNPECLRLTGFENNLGRPRAIAEAAHISPASSSGPVRLGVVTLPGTTTPVDVRSSANGLWLCKNCHKIIDDDASRYPASVLANWKASHTARMNSLVGKDLEASLLILRSDRMYHQEARELLVDLDDRRMMFNDIAIEFPPHVQESVFALREKIRALRGRISLRPESTLARTLEALTVAIHKFLDEVGIELRSITVTSGDPDFERYCVALTKLRKSAALAVEPLSLEEGVEVVWVADAIGE